MDSLVDSIYQHFPEEPRPDYDYVMYDEMHCLKDPKYGRKCVTWPTLLNTELIPTGWWFDFPLMPDHIFAYYLPSIMIICIKDVEVDHDIHDCLTMLLVPKGKKYTPPPDLQSLLSEQQHDLFLQFLKRTYLDKECCYTEDVQSYLKQTNHKHN